MGAGTHDDVAEAARVLRDRTAGNPFLLGELWRDLSTRRGRDALDGVGDVSCPRSVRALIAQRLAGLTVFERDTLSRGAVIGEAFAVEMVQRSAPRFDAQPGHTLKALSRARAVGLIEAVPGSVGEFRFPHSLAREAIIALIDPYELATMHAAVGDALERRIAGEPSLLPKLAYHLEQAVVRGWSRAPHGPWSRRPGSPCSGWRTPMPRSSSSVPRVDQFRSGAAAHHAPRRDVPSVRRRARDGQGTRRVGGRFGPLSPGL